MTSFIVSSFQNSTLQSLILSRFGTLPRSKSFLICPKGKFLSSFRSTMQWTAVVSDCNTGMQALSFSVFISKVASTTLNFVPSIVTQHLPGITILHTILVNQALIKLVADIKCLINSRQRAIPGLLIQMKNAISDLSRKTQ